ncbi:unnamed protein product [Rhizophagus irregularis]|nr:unnamed protein product [Rhizophagus irregularis]
METKMQNSIRYSTVLTIIEISDHVEIGKLIGRKGRNLKPIEKGTDNENRDENISTGEWINKAICQIGKLLEDIEIRNRKKDIEKEKNNSRISDNGNHQHATVATPRNHKDNDQKEKRKRSKRKCRIRPKLGNHEIRKTLEEMILRITQSN